MVVYRACLPREPVSGPIQIEPSNAQGCIAILNTEMSPQRYLADSNWDLIRSEG